MPWPSFIPPSAPARRVTDFLSRPGWWNHPYLSEPLYQSFPDIMSSYLQWFMDPSRIPFMGAGTKGGPRHFGDVKGLHQNLYKGEKPWSAVGVTRHMEGKRKPPVKPQAKTASNDSLRKFATEMEESVMDYYDLPTIRLWENWTYNNNWKSLQSFGRRASHDEGAYDAVQQNLKRIGIPETVKVFKGQVKGVRPSPFVKGQYNNASLERGVAENYRKAVGVPKDKWEVHSFEVPRNKIVSFGKTEELEIIFSF